MELTVALAKGRLAKFAVDLFEKCGIDVSELRGDTRKLVICDKKNEMKFVLVKPSDVPVYVYRGVADIGIAGKDTLLEMCIRDRFSAKDPERTVRELRGEAE